MKPHPLVRTIKRLSSVGCEQRQQTNSSVPKTVLNVVSFASSRGAIPNEPEMQSAREAFSNLVQVVRESSLAGPTVDESTQLAHQQNDRPKLGVHLLDAMFGTWKIARVFWIDSPKSTLRQAWFNLATVLALQILRAKGSTIVSWTTRGQISSLGKAKFLRSFAANLGALLLLAAVEKMYQRSLRSLRMKWSQYLTKYYLNYYLHLQMENEAWMYNIEQELAYDIDKFVDLSLELWLEGLQGVIHVFFYAKLLNRIAPQLGRVASISALVGTIATMIIGRRMPKLHQLERDAESDYHYALNRTRENGEAILFYGGEEFERKSLLDRYETTQKRVWDRKECRDNASLLSSNFRKIVSVVPYFVIMRNLSVGTHQVTSSSSPVIHSHSHNSSHGHSHHHSEVAHAKFEIGSHSEVDIGAVMQGTEAFSEVLFHMLMIPEKLSEFTRLHTAVLQLSTSLNAMHNIDREKSHRQTSNIQIVIWEPSPSQPNTNVSLKTSACETSTPNPSVSNKTSASNFDSQTNKCDLQSTESVTWLKVQQLTLETPLIPGRQQDTLIRHLSFTLQHCMKRRHDSNSGLLVTGKSGVGKTSLLRSIAGLWKCGEGKVFRPSKHNMMFLPQKPYLALGTLRQQVAYPVTDFTTWESDEQIVRVLSQVGLSHLLHRYRGGLDATARWSEEMSLGEQQRLAIARLVLNRPKYAVLDEATSACDIETENMLYSIVKSTCAGWVSVGHRLSIEQFHNKVLRLHNDGTWELSDLHC